MRVAVAGLQHETLGFAPEPTPLAAFEAPGGWPGLARGGAVLGLAGGVTATAGALGVLGGSSVPILWALALPSGPVEQGAFEALMGEIVAGVRAAAPLDGMVLELHGAMMTTGDEDPEATLLEAVRDALGGAPLAVTLDLHANLSARTAAIPDVIEVYRTYPHTDMAEAGAAAARRLVALIRGAPRPARAFREVPFLVPLVAQATGDEPVRSLLDRPRAPWVGQALGFPLCDAPRAGPSVMAEAETSEEAERAADAVLACWLAAEPRFAAPLLAPAEAVARAREAPPPVILADVQDNPGGGGAQDTTGLLHALVEAGADALLIHLADGEAARAAHAAGVGAALGLALGGRSEPGCGPAPGPWRVEALGDGRFAGEGPMYRGQSIDLGPAALVSRGVTRVIVAARRMQASEPALPRHLGVEPAAERVLALKSSVHFRSAYGPMARTTLLVRAPGRVVMDLAALPFRRARPPASPHPRRPTC